MHALRRTLPLAIAATVLAAVPASAQKSTVETQVWIDVATHSMAGMPDLGALGGLASRMMGGADTPKGYPRARAIPADTGHVLDIAMLNSLQPGTAAEQFVPAGLGVGKSLALLPPPPGERREDPVDRPNPDSEVTIRQYWGCGANVRPGQPKVMTIKVKGTDMQSSGNLAPSLFAPDRDIDTGPSHALWPNQKNTRRVSERSSMVGQHRITGAGVPASLQFELGPSADFMPKIALQTRGELADSIALDWQPVDRARAYFISAMGMQDARNIVLWSSSEVAGAGNDLLNYLTGGTIDKWLKQKVLLAPSTTGCAIPKGIFQSAGGKPGEAGNMASLSIIAYGPETNITWPPRPADPKQPWDPEWNVRVRTKSTASAVLGLDLSAGMDGMEDAGHGHAQDAPKEEEGKGKKLLRGLLRSF